MLRCLPILLLLSLACRADARKAPAATKAPLEQLRLVPLVKGLDKPVDVDHAPGEASQRLYVTEQSGKVRIVEKGTLRAKPWLDVSSKISTDNWEQGLLGLEFHPKYTSNRKFYLNYTDKSGATRVVEYENKEGGPKASRELLKVDQPYGNHNGGHLQFGPDGLLYVGLGDGGAANDPHGHGQNAKTKLGAMVVVDVDKGTQKVRYVGLRNPWRYDFDPATGDLFIADVGQNRYEWVHFVKRSELAKKHNFGWNVVEGSHCFRSKRCNPKPFPKPIVEYDHQTGCSITGGVVYRGKRYPKLQGHYFYADFCTALVRSVKVGKKGRIVEHFDWRPVLDPKNRLAKLSAFGRDGDGELYLASLEGTIYQMRGEE